MTTTDAPPEAPTASPPRGAADAKAQQKIDALALKRLIKPVAPRLALGRVLAAISGILAVVPYVALVQIGGLLLDASRAGTAVDRAQVGRWLTILLT